jgi:hypothetical protein
VIAHELGHQIGDRWDLLCTDADEGAGAGPHDQARPAEAPCEDRRADGGGWPTCATSTAPKTPDYYKDYVRKGAEKEAVLLQAWVQARDKFQRRGARPVQAAGWDS